MPGGLDSLGQFLPHLVGGSTPVQPCWLPDRTTGRNRTVLPGGLDALGQFLPYLVGGGMLVQPLLAP